MEDTTENTVDEIDSDGRESSPFYDHQLNDYRYDRVREDSAHFLVEDTFNNTQWRFELNEADELRELLSDVNNGPHKPRVILSLGATDVSDVFKGLGVADNG